MQKYSDVVLSAAGTPVSGAVITVTTYPDGAAATIYAADGGPAVASVTTNGAGRFSFYAANGHYSLTVAGTGFDPVTYNDIVLFDAADDGASLVKHGSESVASELSALQLTDYAALRAYAGARQSVYVTGYLATAAPSGIAGLFVRDDHDTTSVENGGTIIVATNGKRWKRQYSGMVNVQWFGADPSGTAYSTTSMQAALDTGSDVWAPNGLYKQNGFLKLSTVGQKFIGESMQGAYLLTDSGSTHDILRVAAALVEVSGLLFRPGSINNICVRAYAGWLHLHGNRFLAAVAQSGTAVVLTDQDPAGGTVAGAYTHIIEENHFGASGYTFARDIDDYSVNGITACKFLKNQHLCDYPMRLVKGGGNTYFGNLYQSATGAAGSQVGTAIDLGASVFGEMILGNYFELQSFAILSRATANTYRSFTSSGNHYDTVATTYSASASNFVHEDEGANAQIKNGWVDSYASATQRVFKGPSGSTLLTLDDTNKAIATTKRYSTPTTLSFTADSQTQTPASEYAFITGAGAARATCVLGKAGVQDGQRLVLVAQSWAVTLTNTNVRFANGAATAQLGGTAGMVQSMELVFSSAYAMWIEICRSIY